MSGQGAPPPSPPGLATLLGVARLVRFRADGWPLLGGTARGFTTSLWPLLAFPLVTSLWTLLRGGGVLIEAIDLLTTLIAVVAPAVLSEYLARRWDREAGWLRYATGFNWCQLAIVLGGSLAAFVVAGLAPAGPGRAAAAGTALLATAFYALVLQWFLARSGLGLGRWRAAGFTLLVNTGTGVLALGPAVLSQSMFE